MELLPLVSFCKTKGSCAFCGGAIPWRYFITECVMIAAFLCIYQVHQHDIVMVILMMVITVIMVVMCLTDLSDMIIPDSLQIALLCVVLAVSYHRGDMTEGLAGGAFALGMALVLSVGYRLIRKKEGLGMADVKLFPIVGYMLGFEGFISFMLYAGVMGTVFGLIWTRIYSHENGQFPFGPALLFSLWLCLLYPSLRIL
jgi:leader peptidase (prepilin peptidase)/N-methyltransferase